MAKQEIAMEFRTERDAIGTKKLPVGAYYGAKNHACSEKLPHNRAANAP